MRKYLFASIFLLAFLSGCSPSEPPLAQQIAPTMAQQPAQPVVVQQQPNSGIDGTSLIGGMLVGHMLSNIGGNGGSSHHTTVINRTVVAPRTVYRSAPSYHSPNSSYRSSSSRYSGYRR